MHSETIREESSTPNSLVLWAKENWLAVIAFLLMTLPLWASPLLSPWSPVLAGILFVMSMGASAIWILEDFEQIGHDRDTGFPVERETIWLLVSHCFTLAVGLDALIGLFTTALQWPILPGAIVSIVLIVFWWRASN